MKRYQLLITIILLVNCIGISQTASDYYFNLKTGNYWIYHTTGNPNWESRTTIERIDGTDKINGTTFYKQVGIEVADTSPTDSVIFHIFWLKQDNQGNVLIGAFSDRYSLLDSAIIIDPAQPYFPNGYLTTGFATHRYDEGSKPYMTDSVVSVTETVTNLTGTYNNCIKLMELYQDSSWNNVLREYIYYAKGVGEVQRVRDIPEMDSHINNLSQSNIVTAVEKHKANIPGGYYLYQNYPNPFNPATAISYQLSTFSYVTLKIYDVLGREVKTLVAGYKAQGKYTVNFIASDLSSGVYYYQLHAGNFVDMRKLILLK